MMELNVERLVPEQVIPAHKECTKVWVADDGSEFDDRRHCEEYERALSRKNLTQSSGLIVCKALNDMPLFDGGSYDNDSYDYIWIKVLSECGRTDLKKAYPHLENVERIPIGKWCVLEISCYDDCGYWECIEHGFSYVEQILKELNKVDPDVIDKVSKVMYE